MPSSEHATPERWLHLLCSMTPGATRAVAVLDSSEESSPLGWPDPAATLSKAHVAEARRVAGTGKPSLRPQTLQQGDQLFDTVAVPLHRKNFPNGGLVVDLPHRPAATQQAVIQHLFCGAAWLELILASEGSSPSGAKDILELLALTMDTQALTPTLVRFVTEIAVRRGLSRASVGFNRRGRIQLAAISHSASFDPKSDIAAALEQAMQETLLAGQSLAYPHDELPEGECAAHAFLLKEYGAGAVYSFGFASPESSEEASEAILLVETHEDRRLTPADRAFCEAAANMVGPVLATRRRESRSVLRIARTRLARVIRERLGPDRFSAKIAAAAAVLAIAIVWLPVPHRVSADAVLEGTVQRAVVAASDGYIGEARARAGDEVIEGELIAALDATELELEKVQWQTRRAQTRKEQRQARARREIAEAKILAARLAQADAELAALEVQVERSRLIAPFHGVIVKGDLSQSLGAPVERGEVLFEIAPLDSYRVTLEVDERDIAHIAVGQLGDLALTALPHQQHPFRVERVTPMASAEDGRNFFRVEADLTDDALGLRPGMEGVAKIDIGKRSLLWVATHRAADWFRLVTWGWWL